MSDESIIAAGERVSARLKPGQPLTATALWKEFGGQGRSDRMFEVWQAHCARQKGAAPAGTPSALPEVATRQLDATKASLDQFAQSLYQQISRTLEQRFAAEREETRVARQQVEAERRDAGEALEGSTTEIARLKEQVATLERQLVRAETRREVAEEAQKRDCDALRAASQRVAQPEVLHAAADAARQAAERRSIEVQVRPEPSPAGDQQRKASSGTSTVIEAHEASVNVSPTTATPDKPVRPVPLFLRRGGEARV